MKQLERATNLRKRTAQGGTNPIRCRYLSSLLLAAAFFAPAVTTGCVTRTYRGYDPYHNDYHRWDNHEAVYYRSSILIGAIATFGDWTAISKGNIGTGDTAMTMTMTMIMLATTITTGTKPQGPPGVAAFGWLFE